MEDREDKVKNKKEDMVESMKGQVYLSKLREG